MSGRRIVVVGSLNMDLVVRCDRAPLAGETVRGSSFTTFPGGKGANQAFAAARLGAEVQMVGCVGDDEFGTELCRSLAAAGVDVTRVARVDCHSGTALILVEHNGENRIVVVPGANARVSSQQVREALVGAGDAIVLVQLEIPLAVVEEVAALARKEGASVLLNAAPAQPLAASIARNVDQLIVNETEAEVLSRIPVRCLEDARRAAHELLEQGFGAVTLTLGEHGALHRGKHLIRGLAPKVPVVDATGAGDAFCGAFAAALAGGLLEEECLATAIAAGSLAVTRKGAQPSLPGMEQVAALRQKVQILSDSA